LIVDAKVLETEFLGLPEDLVNFLKDVIGYIYSDLSGCITGQEILKNLYIIEDNQPLAKK